MPLLPQTELTKDRIQQILRRRLADHFSHRCRYTPFRGVGHYEMQTERQTGGSPRCYYDNDGIRVSFTVRDCPAYGVLDLCDLDTSTPPAA